jgi:hypothetical protein
MEDREPIYDAQIAPLMTQIIAICKEHGIPMAATFRLNDGEPGAEEDDVEDGGPLRCTTFIPVEGVQDERLEAVYKVLYRGWNVTPPFLTMTVRTTP